MCSGEEGTLAIKAFIAIMNPHLEAVDALELSAPEATMHTEMVATIGLMRGLLEPIQSSVHYRADLQKAKSKSGLGNSGCYQRVVNGVYSSLFF